MQQQHPKLRDQRKLHANEPYALNSIPDEVVYMHERRIRMGI